jgi:hypothetical protein
MSINLKSRTAHLLSESRLSYLLLIAAIFTVIASGVLMFRLTDGFSESISVSGSHGGAIAVLLAGVMLLAANFAYQIVMRLTIPYSRKMLVGFVIGQTLYSMFMLLYRAG